MPISRYFLNPTKSTYAAIPFPKTPDPQLLTLQEGIIQKQRKELRGRLLNYWPCSTKQMHHDRTIACTKLLASRIKSTVDTVTDKNTKMSMIFDAILDQTYLPLHGPRTMTQLLQSSTVTDPKLSKTRRTQLVQFSMTNCCPSISPCLFIRTVSSASEKR
jgi:hypothetical protein